MIRRAVLVLACAGAIFGIPIDGRAQDVPLSQLLVELLRTDIVLAPPPPGFVSHEAHFMSVGGQNVAPDAFNQALVTQLATVPIGSPSGGFSFTFDRVTGTFQRATDTFGSTFTDRALTNGAGKFTAGLNHQYSQYSSFEGDDLKNGEVDFYLRHADTGGQFFEGDLINEKLKLDMATTTTTMFVNYGVTNRFDVAMAVPYVRVRMDASVDATILRLSTGNTNLHSFDASGSTNKTFISNGFADGIGDISVRTKYRFLDRPGGGLAAGVNLRLPSGDAENLLGTGAVAGTGTLIGSATYGKLSPHVNLDYTVSAHGDVIDVPNEFGYRFGVEFAASPRITISGDGLGRSLFDAGRLARQDTVWNYLDITGVQRSTTLNEYVPDPAATLNLFSAVVGAKVNVAGNLLITGNVLFALSSGGVVANVTPVIGFDYSF